MMSLISFLLLLWTMVAILSRLSRQSSSALSKNY